MAARGYPTSKFGAIVVIAMNGEAANAIASKSPVVAIVDDDDVFRDYLTLLFKANNCHVKEASCGRDLFDILAAQSVDCVILDYNLANENGLSIHAQLKDVMRDAPPIVMLTVERNERTIIKAFRGGISDYVLKTDLKPDELFRAVTAAIEQKERARAHDAEVARLKRKSEFDDATGLYSRASIDERLAGIAKNRRAARCAIILVTLDNLDAIAEKFGQVVADRAMRAFVARFKKALGPYDIGGRYDSARIISITDVDVRFKTIEIACERLARELSFDVNFDALAFRLTASIGAAIYPLNGSTMEAVLSAAEQALRNATARGLAYAVADSPQLSGVRPPVVSRNEGNAPSPILPSASDTGLDTVIERRKGDRRSAPRHRVLKRGQIMMPDLRSVVECTIRDMSPKGARLRVEGLFVAPDQFDLVFSATGERRHVVKRWQKANEFGVQFVD
jgi:diguanylate cyclase (GGDEF)-like protein